MQSRLPNSPQTPIKAALNEPMILSPDGRNSLGYNVNLPTAYSTVRPVVISQGYPAGQVFMQGPSQIQSNFLQSYQTSAPFQTRATLATGAPPSTNTTLPPLVQRQTIASPQKIVEQIKIKRPVETIVQGEPQVITQIKYEKLKADAAPPVQIQRKSNWEQYYGERKTYVTPPPAAVAEEKPACNPVILGILGVLALAGLITGIVLAARANNGYGSTSESPKPQSPGVPTTNTSAPVIPISPVVPQPNATNTTAPTPIQINPISIIPQTIAADPSKTVTNTTIVWTAPVSNTTTVPASNTTGANTTTPANTTAIAATTTTTSNTTMTSTGPVISQPVYDVASKKVKHRHRLQTHSLRQQI